MSPHAEIADSSRSSSPRHTNGAMNGYSKSQNGRGGLYRSHLRAVAPNEVHDLLGVGFGPASLAIAVALHDALDQDRSQLGTNDPKVAFLERQHEFAWHAGMQIPGAKMQITFLKDLATLRNPRSEFTFLNYLHQNNRLVQFTNLGTFLPRRMEYEDYMRWCAGWFEELVAYSEEVQHIQALPQSKGSKTIGGFTVISRNALTGETTSRQAKNVVIAVGGRPRIPKEFPQNHPRVIHSSRYRTGTRKLSEPQKPLKIAVIGAGQSAAEIFNDLPSQFPNSTSYLLIKGDALRPSDDSPFVNEIFDPSRVDDVYSQDPAIRMESLALDKGTNYGVVRLDLLEHIYNEMYTQRIKYGDRKEDHPRRILKHRTVTAVSELKDSRLKLEIANNSSSYSAQPADAKETLDVDLVIVASGYERNVHEDMLREVRHLMPGGDVLGKPWDVDRNYRVKFEDGAVSPNAGVWLQGCNEKTHGLSDTLLSILAIRGGEMVESIFGSN